MSDQLPPRQRPQAFSIPLPRWRWWWWRRFTHARPAAKKGPFKFLRKDEGHLASTVQLDQSGHSGDYQQQKAAGNDSRSLREAIAEDMRRGRTMADPFAEAVVAVPKRAPPPSVAHNNNNTNVSMNKSSEAHTREERLQESNNNPHRPAWDVPAPPPSAADKKNNKNHCTATHRLRLLRSGRDGR